jgi:hypothetical protein
MKYGMIILSRLHNIETKILSASESGLAVLCDEYLSIKRDILYTSGNDEELDLRFQEVSAALIAAGGARYLTENKEI